MAYFKSFCEKHSFDESRFQSIIDVLTSIGFTLIELDGQLYQAETWECSDTQLPEHNFSGRNISLLIKGPFANVEMPKEIEFGNRSTQYTPLIQAINALPSVRIKFHHSFLFKSYLAS